VTGDAPTPEPVVYSGARSLAFERPLAASRLAAAVSCWAEDLGSWARERGYLVGHIKALLECEDGYAGVSGTGGAATVSASAEWGRLQVTAVGLKVTAIVFGPTGRQLDREAAERLDRALGVLGDPDD
jgi:hypothetical protein